MRCAVLLVLLALAAACPAGREARKNPPVDSVAAGQTSSTSAAEKAGAFYELACATCHGRTGRGDGPAGRDLLPPPRDYGDATWQSTVSDDFLARAILGGGEAVGKSPVMPAYPELADQPEVVAELVRIVRGFGR